MDDDETKPRHRGRALLKCGGPAASIHGSEAQVGERPFETREDVGAAPIRTTTPNIGRNWEQTGTWRVGEVGSRRPLKAKDAGSKPARATLPHMRRMLVTVLVLTIPFVTVGCDSAARTRCKTAIRQAYMDADKVLQQPIDLDAVCAAWDNHPPGYGLP